MKIIKFYSSVLMIVTLSGCGFYAGYFDSFSTAQICSLLKQYPNEGIYTKAKEDALAKRGANCDSYNRYTASTSSPSVKSQSSQSQSTYVQANTEEADDLTCKKYGFKPNTSNYGVCRQNIDMAKQSALQKQREYEEQKRQYDEQVAAIQKERDRQRSLKQLELGLRMMSGQPIQDAVRETAGMPPLPKPPGPVNQTIVMPGGRIVNCHTTGTVTNCF